MVADITVPSAAEKNNTCPSARHRGLVPPAVDTSQPRPFWENSRTNTSSRPDSSDVYATHRGLPGSGENWPSCSLNSLLRNGVDLRSPPPVVRTHRSFFDLGSN